MFPMGLTISPSLSFDKWTEEVGENKALTPCMALWRVLLSVLLNTHSTNSQEI